MRIVATLLLLYLYSISLAANDQADHTEKTACAYKCCPQPHACQPACCTGTRPMPSKGLIDAVRKLENEIETLAMEIKKLNDTNETLAKKIESLKKEKEKETSPKANIDSASWLTFLAILIALSAYMANLRWGLIQKIEQIDSRTGDFEDVKNYSDVDLAKKKEKYQGMINWISLTDFLLVVSAWACILLLFSPNICSAFKWPESIVVLFFILAAGVFTLMHITAWCKTIKVMNEKFKR